MTTFKQLRQGVVGYLDFVPPEGAPDSSVSLVVFTDGATQLEGETWPVSLSASPSTTTTVEVLAGADVFTVADITGFRRGRTYQLIDADGARHGVVVEGVDPVDSTLLLDRTFDHDLPVGTTITALRHVYTLSPALTADSCRALRAKWTYTIDGEVITRTSRFDIVAEPFTFNPTPREIAGQDPKSAGRLGSLDEVRSLADGAMQRMQADLERHNLHPDLVRNRNVLHLAGINAMLYAFYGSDTQSIKVAQSFDAKYREFFDAAIVGNPQYDSDDDQSLIDEAPQDGGSLFF